MAREPPSRWPRTPTTSFSRWATSRTATSADIAHATSEDGLAWEYRGVVLDDGLSLFFQDVERTYGDKVRAYRVEALIEDAYSHTELDISPILEASRDGDWRGDGMHHVDPVLVYTGVENVVPVDGKMQGSEWSIGIYRHRREGRG